MTSTDPGDTALVALHGVDVLVRTWPRQGSDTDPAGRPVLLLHATGESSLDWAHVASDLRSRRTVVALDARGHAGSSRPGSYRLEEMAADALAVAGSLPVLAEADTYDVVGHSMGGLVALLVAATEPRRVRRVVLEDVPLPHPRTPNPPARPDADPGFDWEMVLQVRAQIDDPDPGWADVARSVGAPTLVVWGGPSSPMPAEHVEELARTLPAGRLVRVDAGHLVHDTDPDGFLAAVRPFLDTS
ncbi:alpha/beta fold hydrolase [Intrasporangium flavum]|uniref:alpha/beta fold hydrolase n=1 Tax=Intrasporangium flavum TaxID=1428657 RepID=UPI001F620552|nr:alpha/beta fold hydrolase [Intrasporangium flavum]